METIISFTFNEGRGHMTLVLDKFFPTDATRLRKLLKLVDEDYEHRDELRATIVQHCGRRASESMDASVQCVNDILERGKQWEAINAELNELNDQINKLQEYINTHCSKKEGQAYRAQLKELKTKQKEQRKKARELRAFASEAVRRQQNLIKQANKLKKNAEVADYDK